jgi:nitrate reductase assembly molybdenum cofactor insertion protein NarJ
LDSFSDEGAVEMNTDSGQNNLLREAAEWRLISLLFECPTKGWREQVAALAGEITDEDLKLAANAAQDEATEGLYHSIFGPGGPAPAREVSYRDWVQPGYLLSELSGYYNAFSFHPATQEVADHVSVEAAFIAYLRLKEAYALDCFDSEHASVTAEAAQNFIKEHLSNMVEPLSHSLALSGVRYLSLTGTALLQRVGTCKEKISGRHLIVLDRKHVDGS